MLKDLYFTWEGLGDNLVLFAAAANYFDKTGKKLLVGSDWAELAAKCPFVELVEGFSFRHVYKLGPEQAFTEVRKRGYEPKFVSAAGYNYLAPTFDKNVTLWASKHMITRYCERLGLSDEIQIEIPLSTPVVRKQSRKICVMTGGKQKYKALNPVVMQYLVDHLKGSFDFVQLGSASDPRLDGVEDLRGKKISVAFSQLQEASCFVGMVGGLVHLAKAANCNSCVLQSTGEPLVLTYYNNNRYLFPIDYCDLCARNLRDPQHQPCFYGYKCSNSFTGQQLLSFFEANLDLLLSTCSGKQVEKAIAEPVVGLEDFYDSRKTLSCVTAYY